MNKLNFTSKNNGDTLQASEWNTLVTKTDELVQAINDGAASGSGSGSGDSHVSFDASGKHNLTIATTSSDQYQDGNKTKGGKINIEPISDLQIKPGDDIIMCSHHREDPTEVSLKIHDGEDHPVKLQVNTADIVLTTKDKDLTKLKDNTGADTSVALYDDPAVLNVTVNSAKNTRGYLKVRAQAIDLRSESHGGIALQPKGEDGQHHMNKIKFEHGGGDGLEFGTFNTEKTSIYTDEYRFKRDGVWKMATRTKSVSDKYNDTDETTHYKYTKQADDFYDIIAPSDEQCTTKDIIKTAFALNGAKDRHTKITNKGAVEIATNATYSVVIEETPIDVSSVVNINTIAEVASEFASVAADLIFNDGDFLDGHLPAASTIYTNGTQYFSFTEVAAPAIKIDSGSELKLGGILDFGSTFNFGETDGGIEVQYKLTKKNATKDCGVLKVVGINNHTSNNLTVEGVTVAPGETSVIALCSILDIIKLVNYMKNNNQGPWAQL